MSATNLKKIAESLSKTSGDAQARLARIAESLRGPKPVAAPGKRAEQPASGGFYGPLSEATSHLVDVTNLIAEIEVVLGIREGDAIVGPNLNA